MENKFVSLCLLSYKRPQQLIDCLDSLHKTIDFPCEIIVNDDTGVNIDILRHYFADKKISKLILGNGNNRGVGRAFQNCLGIAEGEYIVKVDTDLTFEPGWLSKVIRCLETHVDIGAVGLFDYNKWDPNDERFMPKNNILETRQDCLIVKDFVSSIYAFRKEDLYPWHGLIVPDDGLHTDLGNLHSYGRTKLALIHSVINTAFGVGRSTYVSGTMENPVKTETYNEPLLFCRRDISK